MFTKKQTASQQKNFSREWQRLPILLRIFEFDWRTFKRHLAEEFRQGSHITCLYKVFSIFFFGFGEKVFIEFVEIEFWVSKDKFRATFWATKKSNFQQNFTAGLQQLHSTRPLEHFEESDFIRKNICWRRRFQQTSGENKVTFWRRKLFVRKFRTENNLKNNQYNKLRKHCEKQICYIFSILWKPGISFQRKTLCL